MQCSWVQSFTFKMSALCVQIRRQFVCIFSAFCKTIYLEYINVGLLRVPTRPYFPNPILYFYNCFSYDHTRIRYPGPQWCVNCSNNFHGEECDEKSFCRNCMGDHQCPVYQKEVEMIKVKVRDNVSFPEASRRKLCLNSGTTQWIRKKSWRNWKQPCCRKTKKLRGY